jgi:hypothetical protein
VLARLPDHPANKVADLLPWTAVVASARAGLDQRMEALGFVAIAVRLLVAIAIACLALLVMQS